MYCMGENCLDGYGSMSVLPSRFIYIVILESQSCLALNFSLRIYTRPKETKMNRKKVQFQPRSQKYFKSCTQSVALGSFQMSLEVSFSQVFNRLGVSFFFFFLSPKGLESPICRFFRLIFRSHVSYSSRAQVIGLNEEINTVSHNSHFRLYLSGFNSVNPVHTLLFRFSDCCLSYSVLARIF